MKKTEKQAKRLGFLVIALVAVIGFAALPLTGCQEADSGPSVTRIVIKSLPTTREYEIGDSLDTSGLVITVTYSDGTSEDVSTDLKTIGFESITKGQKNISVIYKGQTSPSFSVTVTPKVLSIGVTTQPTKIVYAIGETLNTDGMVVTAVYSDLDTPTGTITEYTVGDYDFSTAGVKTIDVTYKGKTAVPPIAVTVNAFNIATPNANPAGGNYTTAQSVLLTTVPTDAAIYYTLDGTDPTAESTPYTGAISITGSTTLKAIAVKESWNNSNILTAVYTFPVATPTATPAPGNLYFNTQNVTLSTTPADAAIYYTINGDNPTTSSTLYTTPISVSTTTTIKAIAVKEGWDDSDVFSATYTIVTNFTNLIDNAWGSGNIAAAGGEQWFKFTSTGTTQRIYFQTGTLTGVYVQLYAADGTTSGERTSLSSTSNYTSRTVANTTVYYIKVTSSSTTTTGTYRIAFNNTTTSPSAIDVSTVNATQLTIDEWKDGTLTTGGEQWFKFTSTATATTQYIHFQTGTLDSVYIQLYTAAGGTSGTSSRLYYSAGTPSYSYQSRTVTINTEYYIRVWPYSSTGNGAYKIGVNTTTAPPPITIPTTSATELTTVNTWNNGNITAAGGEQWFKFTATAATQYIHFKPGTLTSVYVQLYDSDGRIKGTRTNLSRSAYNFSVPSLTTTPTAAVYYIRVTLYSSTTAGGTYSIGFATSTTPPSISAPSTDDELTNNVWKDGNITTAGGEQWFKFTPTNATTYIHFQTGKLRTVYVQLYDSTGTAVGQRESLNNTTFNVPKASLDTTKTYFINVTPSSATDSGTYKIGVVGGTTTTPPSPTITTSTDLTIDQWKDDTIDSTADEKWYKFNTGSTSGALYIYFQPGTLSGVYVQLFKSVGGTNTMVGSAINDLNRSALSTNRTVEASADYYIRVTRYSSGSGTYKIGVNFQTSSPPTTVPPTGVTATELTNVNTWYNGSISTSSGEQWFKFTATAATQYIYFQAGALYDVYVQVYDSEGRTVGNITELYSFNTNGTSNTSRTVSIDSTYYIRVWPYSSGSGAYKMAFGTTNTAPAVTQ